VRQPGPACGNGGPTTAAQLSGPFGVWIDPLDRLVIADGRAGLRQLAMDGTLSSITGIVAYDVRSVVGDATGSLYAAVRNPDYIIQVDPISGQVRQMVGTGTSGYNGNSAPLTGLLLPGTSVQINAPAGLSVDLNGNVLFADTGNNLVRAYVPSSGSVIDHLGGMIGNNGPQGGYNGDGQWANQTQLQGPTAVGATAGAWVVVADSGNKRLRQLGPSPANEPGSTMAASLERAPGPPRASPVSTALPTRSP
jgi:hypothetical protein